MSSDQSLNPKLQRHFTATGFVVYGDSVLLHWHKKVLEWLPPGGHIEPNEDPVQAVIREVKEETGLDVEIYGAPYLKQNQSYPMEIITPRHILIEDINDPVEGLHQHIDMIYYCRPGHFYGQIKDWVWVSRKEFREEKKLISGHIAKAPPHDVKEIAVRAIDMVG